ncbi:agamous-like MADS-box protein AGL80 [Bidens hawaiensis]|uniref:agamous-like MADS-box protein AGL80 n=1 Tax=Bidens hawaiensis TaxID=980011 RepID=UPI00404AF905
MPRSTNKYKFIEDEEARSVAMRKGKKSLIKKMSELTTRFSDVDACLVIYDKEGGPLTVWPSTAEAQRLIQKYVESKKCSVNAMQNHAAFLEKKIAKVKENTRILMMKHLHDVNAIGEITCKETLSELRSMLARETEVMEALIKEKEASSSTSSSSKPDGV